jgi:hypothetical protein
VAPEGKPAWHDVETPVAKVTGAVDVAVLNHHGVRDTTNAFFVGTLQPRIFVVSLWSSSHLAAAVLSVAVVRHLSRSARLVRRCLPRVCVITRHGKAPDRKATRQNGFLRSSWYNGRESEAASRSHY